MIHAVGEVQIIVGGTGNLSDLDVVTPDLVTLDPAQSAGADCRCPAKGDVVTRHDRVQRGGRIIDLDEDVHRIRGSRDSAVIDCFDVVGIGAVGEVQIRVAQALGLSQEHIVTIDVIADEVPQTTAGRGCVPGKGDVVVIDAVGEVRGRIEHFHSGGHAIGRS